MFKKLPLIKVLIFLFVFVRVGTAAEPSWELMSQEEGIKAWKKDIPGSPLVAFRGEGIVEASVAKVATVLNETSRKTEWVHGCVRARNVRSIAEFERIEYNHTTAGVFIVSDRDFVFNGRVQVDPARKVVYFKLKSVEDALAPEESPVRGTMKGLYILKQIEPNRTLVMVEIHADPKGILPAFLVNLFQKAWPTRTIRGIRKQSAKADLLEHSRIKEILENKVPNPVPASDDEWTPNGVSAWVEQKSEAPAETKPAPKAEPKTESREEPKSDSKTTQTPEATPSPTGSH